MLSDIGKVVTRGKILSFIRTEKTATEIQKAINHNSIYYLDLDEVESILRELQNEGKAFYKRGTWCIYPK